MLNISGLNQGVVIDHIKAGLAMKIYAYLNLDKSDCCVAVIKNAKSNKMGKKDIIKIDDDIVIDTDILGFVDPNATVNIIKDEVIVDKKKLELPEKLINVIKCKNPRCISSVEQELPQIFNLTDKEKQVYRCLYCETKANNA